MTYEQAVYFDVVCQIEEALVDEGYDADKAAVEQSLHNSIEQAVAVGWKLLFMHNIQFHLTFEEELLAFRCLSKWDKKGLQEAARLMLQDYVDKNTDQVAEFLGYYNMRCSPLLLLSQQSAGQGASGRPCSVAAVETLRKYKLRTAYRQQLTQAIRESGIEARVRLQKQAICDEVDGRMQAGLRAGGGGGQSSASSVNSLRSDVNSLGPNAGEGTHKTADRQD
jgi:hypothetical protein